MGVENNEVIIATTSNKESMQAVKEWVKGILPSEQSLFAFVPSLVNGKETVFFAPDGSKKGWGIATDTDKRKEEFVQFLKSFDYSDGTNPFDWVEVGYGEYGQKVLRGNCSNKYSHADYHKDGVESSFLSREREAQNYYQIGMERVKNTPQPKHQKFPCNSRVRIADDLGTCMSHFPCGLDATVKYVYCHAFGGYNAKSYCLSVDGVGSVSWYEESQLTKIEG